MKKKHREKIAARVALLKEFTLDDAGFPNRIGQKFHLNKGAVNDTMEAFRILFETDIPELLAAAEKLNELRRTV